MFHIFMDGLNPLADTGLGDFVLFKLINDYLVDQINNFSQDIMERAFAWISVAMLSIATLWITLLGYRIVIGAYRESAMTAVVKALRLVLILLLAWTFSQPGSRALHKEAIEAMDRHIHLLLTGKESSSAEAIDKNLAYTQLAMSAIDAVQLVHGDDEMLFKKTGSLLMAGFGSAGPAMMAGALLLMFRFVLGFLIGVGPLFILALAFEKTQDLFKKWLFYVIGTLFSMATLSLTISIVMELMARVAVALWVGDGITSMLQLGDPEGLSNRAMQQGVIGVILTIFVITAPTAVAALWNGGMGNFLHFSAFSGAGAGIGPQGQPPGTYTPPSVVTNAQAPTTDVQSGGLSNRVTAGGTHTAMQETGTHGLARRGDSEKGNG